MDSCHHPLPSKGPVSKEEVLGSLMFSREPPSPSVMGVLVHYLFRAGSLGAWLFCTPGVLVSLAFSCVFLEGRWGLSSRDGWE
jgi:hypothetical protein